MKLKPRPVKPVRKMIPDQCSLYDGEDLRSVIDHFAGSGIDMGDVIFKVEYGYYEEMDYCFSAMVPEREVDFQRRLRLYEGKLVKYNEWYAENEEEIGVEMETRRLKALAIEERTLLRMQREAEKARKKAERALDKFKANRARR